MRARAIARRVRLSPRKARLVVDQIRGRGVNEAYAILRFLKKRATRQVEKTLRSAVANAQFLADQAGQPLDVDELVVAEAYVNEGPRLKRWRARAMGRAARILHRTCHIVVVVDRASATPKRPRRVKGARAQTATATRG